VDNTPAAAKPVTVTVSVKLWRRVRAEAAGQGRAVSVLVAEALEASLSRKGRREAAGR
jgi:hypothetical protein